MPAVMVLQHSCVPLLIDEDKVIVASPDPLRQEVEDEVRLPWHSRAQVLCTPRGHSRGDQQAFSKEAAGGQIGVLPTGGGQERQTEDGYGRAG